MQRRCTVKTTSYLYCTFGSSILTLLGSGHQNLYETYQCQMYSIKFLMMSREDARNM